MPRFLNLVSPTGKDEFVDIAEFNKNPNAYGKYKIRMVDDKTGDNYDIPATKFGYAQQRGLRAWNMDKPTNKRTQVQNQQPSQPSMSYQDMNAVDYWSNQLGVKPNQDILPTHNKAGLDLPNFGKQGEYVNRTADVLYNEQQKFAKSEEEAKRIQMQLTEANKRAEALKKQISDENQRRQDSVYIPTYSGFYAQLPQRTSQTIAKKLKQEQDNIAKLSAQLNENEYFKRNLVRLEGVASDLEAQASKEILAQEENKSWLSALTTGRDVMRGTYGIQHNEKMNQASAIRENVRETRRLLREASLNNDSFYSKLGRGLRDAFLDINTWDMGVNSVRNSATTLLAKNNLDKGKGTVSDNAVLESSALKNTTSQKTRDAISAWYNAGITTTNMIPFMAYIYSSPFNNIGKGLSSSISKMLTQNVEGALLQRMLPQVVYRAFVNGLKGIGRFAGDVIGGSATALTFANQNILSDALDRYQGQHVGQFTPDGRFVYTGSQNAKGISRSLLEAFATQAIEYQSELVGEYFTPFNRLLFKGLGKSVGYGTKEFFDAAGNKITSRFFGLPGRKISLDKTVDLFSRLTNAECLSAWNKFAKATKFNGVIGEYLEEVIGNMENATLGINNANWGTDEGGVFNPEENMETFLAVAVGSGFMAGLAAPMSIAHKASINRAYNRANANGMRDFGWDSWTNIREQIDNAAIGELPNIVTNLMKGMNQRQAKTIQNYAAFSVAKQGSLIADFKDELEKPHIARVSVDNSDPNDIKVTSFDEHNKPLSVKSFKSEEDAMQYQEMVHEYINNGKNMQVLNELLATDKGFGKAMQIVNQMNDAASQIGLDPSIPLNVEEVARLFYKDPLKRTDEEQLIVDSFVSAANNVAFPSNEINENHETQNGQDIAEGTEIGDQQAIDTINQREQNAMVAWNDINDPDLKNAVTTLTENGATPNQILETLRFQGYSEDVIAAFAELCNAKAAKDGFINRTGQKIEDAVEQKRKQNTFAGSLNGDYTPIIFQVQDENGTPLFVVGGNISADEQGVLSSDGLVILRDEQGNFIQRPNMNGLTFLGTQKIEDYHNTLLTQMQEAVTEQIQSTEYKAPEYNDSDVESAAPEAPQGNGLTAQQTAGQPAATPETQQQEQQQEQESPIPLDENNNPIYHKAPIEATINDIYKDLEDVDARQFVQNNIDESSKEYEKISKKKPKIGTNKDAYLKAREAWQQQVDEAKQKLDYWTSVKNYIQQQTKTTPEDIKAAQDELSGTNARLDFAKQTEQGATTPLEIAGEFVKNAKILPSDFYAETGMQAADARKAFPGMLSNNGVTIASLAEQLVQYDNDNYGGRFFKGDDMEARNYIIQALTGAESRKALGRNMTAEEQEYVRQAEEQRENYFQETYGMSYSDYLAFEEQQMPYIWRLISNFAPGQYDQMTAEYYESLPEDYFTHQNNKENGTEQQDPTVAGSDEILPQPQVDNEEGTGQRQDPAAEEGNGGKGDNPNDEVPGGTQQLNNQTGEEQGQWNTLSEEEAKAIIQNMEDSAEGYVETELSPESWNNSFDENNSIQTPIGRVKMGDNQISKFLQKKRTKEFGMVAPTLSNPDVIVEERSEAKDGNSERATSYIFIKTFNRNGEKIKFYASITVKKDGMEVSVSSHYMNKNAVEKRLMEDNVIYVKDSLLPNSSDMHLAENPNGLPDLLPTQGSNESISGDKDTTKSPNSQENQQKTDKKSDEQQKDEINAAIKKDIDDFIAESTHDVEITDYDEEEYEAKISVDGKPSNIVVTPPMEQGEGMHAEYRPENSSYQELGDLLDEYNKTVDKNMQGFDGEHLAAIFSSVDAAIAFENWLEQRNTEKQDNPLSVQAKRLLDAIEKEDLNEMAAAKKEITAIINTMSHAELSNYAYNKSSLLKQQDTGAKKEVYRYVCNEAKKRADSLIGELNKKIQDKYPGVKVVYDSGSFWITADKDSEYKRGIESLDNNRRWLNENSVDSSSVPSLHEDSMNDWIKAVETRLSEIKPEKTWDEMNDNEKLEYVFSQPILTEEEIKNAPSDEVNKANALAFIKGQQGKINSISYFKVYTDVKHGTGSSSVDNATDDTAQLDETNSGSGRGRRAERKRSGLRDRRVDSESGEQGDPNQSEQQLQRGENGEGRPSDNAGETGDMEVPGDQQPVGRRNPGDNKPGRGSVSDGNGHNVSQQGGNGRSRKNPDNDRRRSDKADGQGTTGNSELDSQDIDSQLQREIDKFKDLLSDYRETKNKKNGNIYTTILPGLTINTEKIEAWGRLIFQGAKIGYLILRKGHTSLSEWTRIMKDMLTPAMHEIDVPDVEIDEFIKEMWHCNLPIGDEIHTIAEWSKIMQEEKLRQAIRSTLEEKKQKQLEAEPIEVKIADKNNIAETLPYLLPLQQDDVYKAEMQFFDESHNDYEHANGKGYMFTNGTGTGKTYTGLGIAKRFIKQGKKRILILTPSSTKVKDWVLDAANLNIEAHNLEIWAKEHGATATTSKGEGVVVTTYANFRQNQALLEDEFDLVIYDESHRLLENKKGGETEGSKQHYMLTNKDENWAFNRLQTVNPVYRAKQDARREFDAQYDKEKQQFQDAKEAKAVLPNLSSPIAEFAGYPKLKEIKQKYDELTRRFYNEIKPQLEEQAKESVKKTKVVFLSATPFNTRENLGYAEGYIFRYPQTGGKIGPRSQFYLTNFGAAYRWRYNRLETRTTNPEAVTRQEIAFSDYLQNQLGTMSGRVIDSEYDYSRDFPTVTFEKAEELNNAFEEIKKMEGNIMRKAFYEVMYNYQYTSVLFEAMKTSCIIPRIRQHLDAGRKIVLFHRRMETANPITPPFREMLNKANTLVQLLTSTKEKNEAKAQIADFEQRFANMLEWEQTIDLRVPRAQILEAFGEEQVLLFSGKETTKQKNAAVDEFNSDASKKKIIVIQEASGKEGISLHDKTGKNQRVLISLAMPQSPITALQVEGRIYRIGNKSNAIFEYPLLGLDEELITWGQRFNSQVGTTENLALGSKARNLRESFAKAVIEHSGDVPLESQGVGGKEMDAAISQDETEPFDKAVLDYYGNQKTSGRRDDREGKDYYPTPEPLGFMMVEWANLSEGESVLEPSAGHGAIARYVPASNQLTSVEPSTSLFGRLQVLAGGVGRKFENDIFENYNIINKHDVVLMNPPFGTAGRLAVDHVAKAYKHLSEGGRIVAIIPRGSADAKFDSWIKTEKSAALVGEIQLPNITFQNAGTQVACRVVVIDKISNDQMRNEALAHSKKIELPNDYAKIEDFFEDLRGITMPTRTIDQKTKNDRKLMSIIKELKDNDDRTVVEFTLTGLILNGIGFDYPNMSGNALKLLVAAQYARANKQLQYIPEKMTRVIAAYEAIKKMALKLADMSEEEMDNFVKENIKDADTKKPIAEQFKYEVKKNTRTGEDMYVVSKASGVNLTEDEYNNARSSAKANGGYWSRYAGGFVFPSEVAAKTFLSGGYINSEDNIKTSPVSSESRREQKPNNVKDSGIIPEDVDKDVSLQIESDFDNEVEKAKEGLTSTEKHEVNKLKGRLLIKYSYMSDPDLNKELRKNNASNGKTADFSTTEEVSQTSEKLRMAFAQVAKAIAKREARYRDERYKTFFGELGESGKISLPALRDFFKKRNKDKQLDKLFDKVYDICTKMATDVGIIVTPDNTKNLGRFYSNNAITINIPNLAMTSNAAMEQPTTVLHEMLHQGVNYAINLVKTGKADGVLTKEQIDAVNTIIDIYNKSKADSERFSENTYGLKDEYEFAVQLADQRHRRALAMTPFERIIAAASELKSKNDTSLLERIKNALIKLFGLSDLQKMDKAVNTILDTFSKSVHEKSMQIVENNGKWGYTSTQLFDKYPTWLSGQTTNTGQHTTQITSTVNTYKKIGDWMKSQGMDGASVLDASSGLGKGTEALRDMGFNVEDVEPYPSENRTAPTYLKYEDIKGKYDVVISNAVLNVIPDDWRADVLKNMADKVKPGGKMIINVRDAKEMERQKQKIELDSPSEILVTDKAGNIRAYQKGFTQKELADWIQSELGEGWTIETAKPSNSGISGRAVVVTRNTDTPLRYRKVEDSMQPRQTNQKQLDRMRAKAESLAKSLNVPVKIITVDEAPTHAKGSKGYYNTQTGEVVIVLDNNKSVLDIEQTVAHEIIGHHGLRGLLGKQNYYKLMNAVYDNLSEEDKKAIGEAARRNGWQLYTAMDEYFADQAEKMVWDARSASLWQNIVHYLTEALRNLGFIFKPNYKDARYWLWLSKNQLKRGDVMSNVKRNALLAKLDKLGNPKPDKLFKDNDDSLSPKYLYREITDYEIEHKPFQEAFQDYAISLKDFLKIISKGLGRDLMDNENAYLGENQMGSIASALAQKFVNKQINHLRKTILNLSDVFSDATYQIIRTADELYKDGQGIINKCEAYLYTKHGLERNRVIYVRDLNKRIEKIAIGTGTLRNADIMDMIDKFNDDFQNYKDWLSDELKAHNITFGEYLHNLDDFIKTYTFNHPSANPQPHEIKAVNHLNQWYKQHVAQKYDPNKNDMSGLSSFEEYKNGGNFDEQKAIDTVESIEHSIGDKRLEELWKAVQDVTQFAIDTEYKSGMLSKQAYNRCKTMFEWYVPLRGVSEDTMEDLYAYLGGENDNGSAVQTAKGRKTLANTPLATAYGMALQAINNGIRNQNNQRMYRAVNSWLKNNPNKLAPATIIDCWYEIDNNGNYEMKTPNITDNMTPEQITAETQRYEEEMKAKQKNGLAFKNDIKPFHVKPFRKKSHANDHIVYVKVNGIRKMIVFNGDPRPARVLRGEMNPSVTKVNDFLRHLSALNTAWNPTFTLKNLSRDTFESYYNIAINENLAYLNKFKSNQLRLMGDGFWAATDIFRNKKSSYLVAFYKWKKGEEPTSYIEKMFFEFMEHGGATGFMEYKKMEELQSMLYKQKSVASITADPFKAFGVLFGTANEFLENLNRFAVYLTSREMGRSVMTSVNNAKEVTLNFNRRGAGDKTAIYGNTTQEAIYGWTSWFFRNTRMFFNPSVQSLYRIISNHKRHPFKSALLDVGVFMLLSSMMPMINAFLISLAGDGGDDDKYSDLSPWTRRNNICIYDPIHKKWITLPIPPNIAAFYGMGDVAYGYVFDKSFQSGYGVWSDIASQLAMTMPFDYIGNNGTIKPLDSIIMEAVVGDVANPILEIATNKDWLGYEIYKDNEWNKNDPEWQKCYSNTNKLFVELSKRINSVGNDYEYLKGPLDNRLFNPGIMQHLFESYTGGFGKDLVNVVSLFKEYDPNKVPVYRGFVRTPDNTNRYQRTRIKYQVYKDEADNLYNNLRKLQKNGNLGDTVAQIKYIGTEEKRNPEYRRMVEVKKKEGYIKQLQEAIKNAKDEITKDAYELELNKTKRDVVDICDQIE